MALLSRFDSARAWLAARWRRRALSRKAITFALVGLANTAVDYGFFLLARAALSHAAASLAAFAALARVCRCGAPDTLLLVAANMISWSISVSTSYVLNSSITFAAETGRQLRFWPYLIFVVSGIAGLLANTATLIAAAQVFLLPVWLAKALAILASFVVNFSMSHLVVFRVQKQTPRLPKADKRGARRNTN
jgi:putative flippase GtrA